MKLNLTPAVIARFWTVLMSALLLITMSGCGGGGANAGRQLGPGGGGGTTANGGITISLTSTAGVAANVIPTGSYLIVSAKVVDGTGSPVANTVVTFTTSNSAGVVSPALGTALTNSAGVAQITLQAGSVSGAGIITASAAVGTATVTATAGYSSSASASSGAPILSISLVSGTGCPANSVSTSCPLTANATLTSSTGVPIPNAFVTFSTTATLTSLTPSAGTALTNAAGVATTTVAPLNLQTALQQAGASGQVNASATVGGVTVIAGAYYVMGNTAINLALLTPPAVTINAYGTTSVSVSVNSGGVPYTAQPVTVNFSSSCQLNGTSTMAATASTFNGIATVTYTAGKGCSGVDTVTASVAGVPTAVTETLTVSPAQASNINFVSANPSSKAIVLPGSGGTGRTSVAILTFKLVDTNNNGIANQTVTFSNGSPLVASLTSGSGITAADGTVSATVNALAQGNFRITATLAGSSPVISAVSDTVLVSTGLPVIASFTAVPLTYNIPGLYLVMSENISVYLADQNSNPVADGTPVSATTDGGAIGTSSQGGCDTVNGTCSMPLVTQNPMPPGGVATLKFTSTSSVPAPGTTLSMSIGIIFSGGDVHAYVPFGAGLWTQASTTINTANCTNNAVVVFTDQNGNPLASGSTITAAATQAGVGTGTLIPAAVPIQAPHTKAGPAAGDVFAISPGPTYVQGTMITIPLTLTASPPTLACRTVANGGTLGAGSAIFNLTVTPLSGVPQLFTFNYTYPA